MWGTQGGDRALRVASLAHIRLQMIIGAKVCSPCLGKTPIVGHVRNNIVGAMLFENASVVGIPPNLQTGTASPRKRCESDAISSQATMADAVGVQFSEARKDLLHIVLRHKLGYWEHCLALGPTSALSCLSPSENIKMSLSVTGHLCSKSIVNRGMEL